MRWLITSLPRGDSNRSRIKWLCHIFLCTVLGTGSSVCRVSWSWGSTDEIHGRPRHVTTDEIPSDGCREASRVTIIVYAPAVYCVHPPLRDYVWVKAEWCRPRHVATDEIPPKRRVWWILSILSTNQVSQSRMSGFSDCYSWGLSPKYCDELMQRRYKLCYVVVWLHTHQEL